jgi:hypothetical protein
MNIAIEMKAAINDVSGESLQRALIWSLRAFV